MDETKLEEETSAHPAGGHHLTARERQRRGPMWGCLRALFILIAGTLLILALTIGSGWWYLGSASFAGLVRLRIEKTLETRLGREVSIGKVEIIRSRPQKIILTDIRIANAPGGVAPYFATVRQVVINGGVESFWNRKLDIGRVDVLEPRIYFEVFPAGSKLVHNFPTWKSGPPARYEIVHVDLKHLFLQHGSFSFLDRKHDISALASDMATEINVTRAEDLYAGLTTSPKVMIRIQDYLPFEVDLRGGFRFTPETVELTSVALKGRDIEAFLSGKVAPLSEGAFDLKVRMQTDLTRIREIFAVKNTLAGPLLLDGRLQGDAKSGFALTGKFRSTKVDADAYTLADVRGALNVSDERAIVDIERARYGGGSVTAHYLLGNYEKPLPMSVDLGYDHISIERLFSDWGVKDTGLRGAATGVLKYQWVDDKLLEGRGRGSAKLSRNAVAFSAAKYPVPLAGSTDFDLDRGVIRFRRGDLETSSSKIAFTGSMKIEGLDSDLAVKIDSSDLSELDRAAFNFARSAGKNDYELLGIGGSGIITGTIKGKIESPVVAAEVRGAGTKYNNVLLGDSAITLRYDGPRSVLMFDRATFTDAGGQLSLIGTVAFPERGPSPRFDIAVEARDYPVDRAIQAVGLDLAVRRGLGTGSLVVTGTPDNGIVRFAGMNIRQDAADLKLNGTVHWLPEKGNVLFDLDIAANGFPITDVVDFLDLGKLPVTGDLTGTLHIQGPKDRLEGDGSIVVRNGSVYGEPIDSASVDLLFNKGGVRANNLVAILPAGEIRGEAEYNFTTEHFSYTINSSLLDLSKVQALASLGDLFGGKLTIQSQGAGTLENPEVVLDATLSDATIRGLNLPAGSPPPKLYVAIRGGQLIIRGSAADAFTIDGNGTVGKDMAVTGLVRITIPDIARLLAFSPSTATVPAAGSAVIELGLGGRISPIEALRIEGSVPQLALSISGQEFTPARPLRFTFENGRVTVNDFELQRAESRFVVTGFAEVTGEQRLGLGLTGVIDAAILQFFVPGLRASGNFDLAAKVGGTMKAPQLAGTADVRDGEFKFPGFPQLIDEVNGTLVFREDRIEVESLRATIGGGQVAIGGFIGVDGIKPTRVRLTIQGQDVALRYYEGISIDGDFNLLLSGDLERMVLQGDVNVDRALYFKDIDFSQSLLNVILSRKSVVPTVSATWQDRVTLRLRVTAPGALAVRNNVADVTGTAELDVSGTLGNPVILGTVSLVEGGTVRFQNVDYRLVRGTINFQNPFRIDPYFDITLEGRMSGSISEVESGPIDVTINITGTVDRITPTITSDPPTSDITLFSILGLGGLTGGTGATATPASLVGQSLLYQSLGSFVGSRILPFADSFTYDPGLIDTGTGSGPKVTFEKRVSNKVRLLVVYNLDSHKGRQVIEWVANRDWTLQLTRDEISSEFRLDARFRRRYNGYWTWGARGREQLASAGTFDAIADAPVRAVASRSAISPTDRPSEVPQGRGAVVVAVSFRADRTFDTSKLAGNVRIATGAPLSIRDVQDSIKGLFATGNFRDVRVETIARDGGVEVTFALFLNYRIGSVTFEGMGEDRQRAEADLVFRTGEVLSLNAVDRSATAVTTRLQRNGYLEATVDPEITFDSERNTAAVILHVERGPLAKISVVDIAGDLAPFDAQMLIKSMKRGPGETFRLAEARTDAERMQKFLVKKNHRRARVTFDSNTYDAATKTVALRYTARVGPVVKVAVIGASDRTVRRLAKFRGDQEYSEDVVDRTASRIVRHYQDLGYYNAAVDTEGKLENGIWTTTYDVRPGIRYRLADVTFSGNIRLSDKELSKVVSTSARGGLKTFINRLFKRANSPSGESIGDDRDALESYYRLQGFSEATVADPVVKTDDAAGTMTVDFPVNEGTQTLLAAVRLEGNEQVRSEDLPESVLREGRPLNPQFLHDDLIALQTYYSDRGNAEVQVTPRIEVSADKTKATLVYVVAEGPQVTLDQVAIRGNTYTRTELIRRKVDLKPGAPFSYTALLKAQQNLYRLGIFRRVDVQPEQTGTSVSDRNVSIQVEEGRNLTLSGAVGVVMKTRTDAQKSDIAPRISAAIAHRNLFGTGRYLGFEGVFSSLEREAFITFREPYIGRYDVPVQFTIFQTDDYTRKETRILQRGASIEASIISRLTTRWSLRYEYKISECTEGQICRLLEDNIPVEGLDRSLLNIQISSITPTVFWDRRNDVANPSRGFFSSASIEYAFPLLDAETHFVKEFVQGAWYIPVGRSVLALSGRAGLIQPMTVDRGGVTSRFVPLSERFTAGGDTSHRAYPLDLLGSLCEGDDSNATNPCEATLLRLKDSTDPNDTGRIVPIGGNGLLLFNAEYRFPIVSSVGGAVFTDIGNVYAKTIRFDDLRYGVGVGVRYLSPVGPLRFDVGWPLDRRSYDPAVSYFLTLGYAF